MLTFISIYLLFASYVAAIFATLAALNYIFDGIDLVDEQKHDNLQYQCRKYVGTTMRRL